MIEEQQPQPDHGEVTPTQSESPPSETADSPSPSGEPLIDDAIRRGARPRFKRGLALDGVEGNRVAAERRATVVVLAGTQRSGKTTLLASLYDQLGRGPFGGHQFIGSRTLGGFAQRAFWAQMDATHRAGRQRSQPIEAPWLHLRLRRADRDEPIELLLGDYPGEDFEAIAKGATSARDHAGIWRADHLGVVIHGGKLALQRKRAEESRTIKEILEETLKDPDTIAGPQVLTFIVTMWDLVEADEEASAAADALVGELSETVASAFPDGSDAVAVIRTAARSSRPESMPSGHGVDDLLARWSDQPAVPYPNVPPKASG